MLSNIYPTLLLSGTATGLRFATNATGAFFDNAPAELMTEIAKYPIVCLDIIDGSALLRAYTGSSKVGMGEILEENVFSTFDFTTWTPAGLTIVDVDSLNITAVSQFVRKDNTHTQGGLYKNSFSYTGSPICSLGQYGGATSSYISNGGVGVYKNWSVNTGTWIIATSSTAGQIDVSTLVSQRVTAPSTSGCTLWSTRAMDVQSLAVNTFAAANYNKSSYTYKLWGMFKTSGRGGYIR